MNRTARPRKTQVASGPASTALVAVMTAKAPKNSGHAAAAGHCGPAPRREGQRTRNSRTIPKEACARPPPLGTRQMAR